MFKATLIGIAAVILFTTPFIGIWYATPQAAPISQQAAPPLQSPSGPFVDVWAIPAVTSESGKIVYFYTPVGEFSAEPPIGPITSWYAGNPPVLIQGNPNNPFDASLMAHSYYLVAKSVPYSQAIAQYPPPPWR